MSREGSVKKDASGRWAFAVDIAPPGAPRKQVFRRGFRTKAEALDALDEVKRQVHGGTFVEPTKQTVGDYLLLWVEGLPASGRKPSTVQGYRDTVGRYVVGTDVGNTPLQGLSAIQLDSPYAAMLKRGLSARTVRYLHSIIGKALSDAERKGLVARNVARLADPPASRATRAPEHAVWTPHELRAFLDGLDGHRHASLLHLAALDRSTPLGALWTPLG